MMRPLIRIWMWFSHHGLVGTCLQAQQLQLHKFIEAVTIRWADVGAEGPRQYMLISHIKAAAKLWKKVLAPSNFPVGQTSSMPFGRMRHTCPMSWWCAAASRCWNDDRCMLLPQTRCVERHIMVSQACHGAMQKREAVTARLLKVARALMTQQAALVSFVARQGQHASAAWVRSAAGCLTS